MQIIPISLYNTRLIQNKQNYRNSNINNAHKSDSVCFSANIKPAEFFVFDLDGSFAEGNNDEINKTLNIKSENNAILIYATSRTIDQLYKLIDSKAKEGINLPLPDYFIASNGQFVYEKQGDKLVQDMAYISALKEKTNFDRKNVYKLIKQLGQTPKYKYTPEKTAQIPNLEEYKYQDPDFYNSKISYYEYCPSDFYLEFMVASNVENPEKDFEQVLTKNNITHKFLTNTYPKSNLDKYCSDDIKRKARPLRINEDGGLYTIHIGSAEKSDAVKYIKEKLNTEYKNITSAGDGHNDICLLDLVREGAKFIALSATDYSGNALLEHLDKMHKPFKFEIIGRRFDPSIDPQDLKEFTDSEKALAKDFCDTKEGLKLILRTYLAVGNSMPDEYPTGFGLFCAKNNVQIWLLNDIKAKKLKQSDLELIVKNQKLYPGLLDRIAKEDKPGTLGIIEGLTTLKENAETSAYFDKLLKLYGMS